MGGDAIIINRRAREFAVVVQYLSYYSQHGSDLGFVAPGLGGHRLERALKEARYYELPGLEQALGRFSLPSRGRFSRPGTLRFTKKASTTAQCPSPRLLKTKESEHYGAVS